MVKKETREMSGASTKSLKQPSSFCNFNPEKLSTKSLDQLWQIAQKKDMYELSQVIENEVFERLENKG